MGECECNGQLRIRNDCKYARSDRWTSNYFLNLYFNHLDYAITPLN